MEVLTAWGTVGGAAITAIAVLVALWQAWLGRKEAKEAHDLARAALALSETEREDVEARQARQVYSLISNATPTCSIYVENSSDEPIAAVEVLAVYLDNMHAPPTWTYALGPGHKARMIAAKGRLSVQVEFSDGSGHRLSIDETRGATAVVSFVDSRGRRWRRWGLVQPYKDPNAASHQEPTFEPETHTFKSPKLKARGE